MTDTDEYADQMVLWPGDTGELNISSRRALLEILKGPFLSGRRRPQLWAALMADESAIRSRLHDLFLDLVIDRQDEFAFTRKALAPEVEIPSALRRERLNFIDTAMLLVLRQLLLATQGETRVFVSKVELYDRLMVYRDTDESAYLRALDAAWGRMVNKLRVLHGSEEDRAEISPVVRFIIDDNRVRALTEVYAGLNRDDK